MIKMPEKKRDGYFELTRKILKFHSDDSVRAFKRQILLSKDLICKFQIVGSIKFPEKDIQLTNGIILKPHSHIIVGKKIDNITREEWDQLYRAEYIIDGSIKVDNDDAETLEKAVTKINETIALISFLFRGKFSWRPNPPFASEGVGSTILSEKSIEYLSYITNKYNLLPLNNKNDVYRAIEWYATGVNSLSKFNQFLCYWRAFEILIHMWHYQFNKKDYKETEFGYEPKPGVIYDAGKTALNHLFDKEYANKKYLECFGEKANDENSLYFIRNKITHGKMYERDTRLKYYDDKKLYNMIKIAKEVILKSIEKLSH